MNKKRKLLYAVLSLLLWLAVWEIAARAIDLSFAVPSPEDTLRMFFGMLITASFWKTVFFSLLRIFIGFLIGVAAAVVLTLLTCRFPLAHAVISPAMTVIKSTPVASFIMVLWIILGSGKVPTVIATLMVMPLVWQNLTEGWRALDRDLGEVMTVFRVPLGKRVKIYVIPSLAPYFSSACIAGIGLAWKAGIAAEIIAYTKNSIGRQISDAKNYFDGPEMFAWTLTVVLLSLAFEFLLRHFTKARKSS